MTHGYEFFEYDYFDLDLLDLIGFGDVDMPESEQIDTNEDWGEIDYDDIVGWL